ncbi:M24 family metallopeptidase [Macrococcus bovicus]|uniref:M24 family metallopeptidase n=1 Tax=Macrococcus bovicus TaxID=69968 RepID=UPI0025A66EF6|nr:Xaa-Pro peptidase family protein [Macrococcus bovicus]WJP96763.1 Xaa-Pro peptidase family protein [Macrococcus bovicus]
MYNKKELEKLLNEVNADVFISTTKENFKYLTGFFPVCKQLRPYNSETFAVIHRYNLDEIHIVHSLGEIDQILDSYSKIGIVHTYGKFYREVKEYNHLTEDELKIFDYSNPKNNYETSYDALIELLKKLKISTVALDEEGLNHLQYLTLASRLSPYVISPGSYLIKKARSIKTNSEIKLLKESSNILERSIMHIKNLLVTEQLDENLIVQEFKNYVTEQGALPMLPMIKIGRGSVGGQRKPNDTKLNDKDFIWFDCDIVYEGYWSDVARIVTKDPNLYSYKDYFNTLRNAQRLAMQRIKPGMQANEVYNLVMNEVKNNGIPHYKRNHVGHGIGLEPYELPVLSEDNSELIEEGMVLCIETPYYEYGIGAIHIEDLVLIKEDGNIILNETNGQLI